MPPAPESVRPPSGALLWVVVFSAFLSALTSSVIGLALPEIAGEFRIDPAEAAWVMLSFLLAVTVLLLPAGRLADLLGHGRMYAFGLAMFLVGSLGCARAPGESWLVGGRIVQGIASSLIMATAPALVALNVPPARRGSALGLMSTGTYVGLALGPPLGGMLIAWSGWRSIFWASVLASVVVLGVGLWAIPLERPPRHAVRFDLTGSLLIGAATLGLLMVATRGTSWGLTSARSLACGLGAVIALVVFLGVESRHPAPTLDLTLFRSGVFSYATLSALLNYVSLFIALFSLPFALRDGQGLSPPEAGRVLGSQAAGMALFAWGSGWLSDRIGSRGLAALGMVLLAVGLGGLAASWPTQGAVEPAAWLFLCGAGTGIFISPNSSSLMGSAPRSRQGIAGGVMGLARSLGMALGTALGSGLLASALGAENGMRAWSVEADRALAIGLSMGAVSALAAGLLAWIGGPRRGRSEGAGGER